MRPLELKMKMFGSYKEEPPINFEQFGRSGLYLISGDTGAGKTTIFDAITYALYGSASGDNRDGNMMRSKFAKETEPTEVVLTFEHRKKKYTMTRRSSYMTNKVRGTGLKKEDPFEQLLCYDEFDGNGNPKIIEKGCTSEITKILGIGKDQFVKIAMIAQGDFQKILFEESKEREGIFRRIFKTERFESFQKIIAQRYKDIEDYYDAKRVIKQSEIERIMYPDDTDIDQKCTKDTAFEVIEKQIGAIISADKELVIEYEEALEKYDKALEQLTGEIKVGEQRVEDNKKLVKYKQDLEAIDKGLETLRKDEGLKKDKLSKAKEYNDKAAGVEATLSQYDSLEQARTQYNTAIKTINNLDGEIAVYEERITSIDNEINALVDEQSQLGNAGEGLANVNAELEKLKARNELIEGLISEMKECATKVIGLQEAQDAYTSEKEEYERLSSEADRLQDKAESLRTAYLDEQAGILADGLEDGKPCPVCGSIHHIKLAVKSEKAPAKADVDSAERKSKDARRKADEQKKKEEGASLKAGELNAKLEEKKTSLAEQLKKNGFDENVSVELLVDEKSKVVDLINKQNAEKEEITRKKERIEELEGIIPKERNALETAKGEKAEKEKSKATAESDRNNAKKNMDDIHLEYESKQKASDEIVRMRKEAKQIEDDHQKAAKSLHDKENEQSGVKANIETLEGTLSKGKDIDVEALKTKKANISADRTRKSDEKGVLNGRIESNAQTLEKLRNIEKDMTNLESQKQILEKLVKTATGDLTGQARVTFETYVQSWYFDRVLSYANRRLDEISGGKYELIRSDEMRGKSKVGLDIKVKDHYNNEERDVKTLSGGESFVASLSLALGLSEVVSEENGGISLESMFVDEGFGSLDGDILEQSINALTRIAGNNKQIGIISHVEGLESMIDRKIIVRKDNYGHSHTEII